MQAATFIKKEIQIKLCRSDAELFQNKL